MIATRIYSHTYKETKQMSKRDFQEAFPVDENYDPGFDYIALVLAVVLALIIVVIGAALCIPLP